MLKVLLGFCGGIVLRAIIVIIFYLTGGFSEYRRNRHRGWKSQTDFGIALEHHFALAGGEVFSHFLIEMGSVLFVCPLLQAAVTEHRELCGLNTRNGFSHSSGG